MSLQSGSKITLLASLVALLSACAAPVPGPQEFHDFTPRLQEVRAQTRASFECGGALPAVHRQVCASDDLSRLDRELVELQRQRLRTLDLAGSLLLESNHRQWLLSRAGQCGLTDESGTQTVPDANSTACLHSLYRQRIRDLSAWPQGQPTGQAEQHAYSAYVEYRLVDSRDPSFCAAMGNDLSRDLIVNGEPVPARLPGVTPLAGINGPSSSAQIDGNEVRVEIHDAGPFGGYQIRARGVSVNGQVIMDDRTLPLWVAQLPNYGGRAHASSSQTGDYGSIDIFSKDGRTLLMVNETWGFYSPAARGESAFSGIYALRGQSLEPVCLFQTYLTPPRTNTLAGMPSYAALEGELNAIAGDPLPGFAQHERRDNFQTWKERQWTLLNLPLLGADALSRYGREAALRKRNDEAMDAFFNWSERNLANKSRYRRVMPMLQPAHSELVQMYLAQGLNNNQARAAADILFHETFARTMENLASPDSVPDLPLAPNASYRPRFSVAPAAGELERGRNFATLYSVLLNNAPNHVIRDFINYETRTFGPARGQGPDNSPALMAAIMSPANVALLLQEGFDPNASNDWGETPLMAAVQLNQAESARLLLAGRADVHAETRRAPLMGVGGPDRKEAAQGRQTALLLAAANADAQVISLLLSAGAATQAWDGYHQQVCSALDGNGQLSAAELTSLKGPLCASVYTPPPVTRQQVVDIRAGDVLTIRDDGVDYKITLRSLEPTQYYGRSMTMSPSEMQARMGRVATNIGTAAVRRAKLRITGPLTLVFDDLQKVTPDSLPMIVSFPVSGDISQASGSNQVFSKPAQTVLQVEHDPLKGDAESSWRALYSAALTQGFTPSAQGYVVVHTRGTRRMEYQLVVTE